MIKMTKGKYTYVVETLTPFSIKEDIKDPRLIKARAIDAKKQQNKDLNRTHPYIANLPSQTYSSFMDTIANTNPSTYAQGDLNAGTLTNILLMPVMPLVKKLIPNESPTESYQFETVEDPIRLDIPFIDDNGNYNGFSIVAWNITDKNTGKTKLIYYTNVVQNTLGDANLRNAVAFYDDDIIPERKLYPKYREQITYNETNFSEMRQELFALLNCKQLQRLIAPIFSSTKTINTEYCALLEHSISKIPKELEPYVIKIGELYEIGAPKALTDDLKCALLDLIKKDDEDTTLPINHLSQIKIKTFSIRVNNAINKHAELLGKPKTKKILKAIQSEALNIRLHTVNPNLKLDDFKNHIQQLAKAILELSDESVDRKNATDLFSSLTKTYQDLNQEKYLDSDKVSAEAKNCLDLINESKTKFKHNSKFTKLLGSLALATMNIEPYFVGANLLNNFNQTHFNDFTNALGARQNDPVVLLNLYAYFKETLRNKDKPGLIEKYISKIPESHEFERILNAATGNTTNSQPMSFIENTYLYITLAPFITQSKRIASLLQELSNINEREAANTLFNELNEAYYIFQNKNQPSFDDKLNLSHSVFNAVKKAKITFKNNPKWNEIFNKLITQTLYIRRPVTLCPELTDVSKPLELIPSIAMQLADNPRAQQAVLTLDEKLCKHFEDYGNIRYEMHLITELPENIKDYKNQYIFEKNSNQLFYVDTEGTLKEVNIANPPFFKNELNKLKQRGQTLLSLTPEEINRLVGYTLRNDAINALKAGIQSSLNTTLFAMPELKKNPKTKRLINTLQLECLKLNLHTTTSNPNFTELKNQLSSLASLVVKLPDNSALKNDAQDLFIKLCENYQSLHRITPLTKDVVDKISKESQALVNTIKPSIIKHPQWLKYFKSLELTILNLQPYLTKDIDKKDLAWFIEDYRKINALIAAMDNNSPLKQHAQKFSTELNQDFYRYISKENRQYQDILNLKNDIRTTIENAKKNLGSNKPWQTIFDNLLYKTLFIQLSSIKSADKAVDIANTLIVLSKDILNVSNSEQTALIASYELLCKQYLIYTKSTDNLAIITFSNTIADIIASLNALHPNLSKNPKIGALLSTLDFQGLTLKLVILNQPQEGLKGKLQAFLPVTQKIPLLITHITKTHEKTIALAFYKEIFDAYSKFSSKDEPTFDDIVTLKTAINRAIATAENPLSKNKRWQAIFNDLKRQSLCIQLQGNAPERYKDFEAQLALLPSKAMRLKGEAREATIIMYESLCKALYKPENQNFNDNCNEILARATPILQKHRGIKGWITEMAETIAATLENWAPAAVSSTVSPKVRFFKSKTDSEKIIQAIEKSLEPKN